MKRAFALGCIMAVLLFSGGAVYAVEWVVRFTDLSGERDAIRTEHAWTEKHFPTYRWKSRRLIQDAHLRRYDRVSLVGPNGEKATIYFDITSWRVRH